MVGKGRAVIGHHAQSECATFTDWRQHDVASVGLGYVSPGLEAGPSG